MTWFENYFIVRSWIERPPFYASRLGQTLFDLVRLIACYGAVVLAWLNSGWVLATVLLLGYLAFNRLTFNRYYRHQIATLTTMYVADGMQMEAATSLATDFVNQTIKGGGRTSFDGS